MYWLSLTAHMLLPNVHSGRILACLFRRAFEDNVMSQSELTTGHMVLFIQSSGFGVMTLSHNFRWQLELQQEAEKAMQLEKRDIERRRQQQVRVQ